MVLTGIVLPLGRQPRLRLQQDLQHRPAVLRREARKVLALVLIGEYLQQTVIHVVLGRCGYRIERVRVDEVAARVAKQAPLQVERLTARGGRTRIDPGIFLDTSSYGTRSLDAVIREVGADRLVYGSDRPVISAVEPSLGDALRSSLRVRNPELLLSTTINARGFAHDSAQALAKP